MANWQTGVTLSNGSRVRASAPTKEEVFRQILEIVLFEGKMKISIYYKGYRIHFCDVNKIFFSKNKKSFWLPKYLLHYESKYKMLDRILVLNGIENEKPKSEAKSREGYSNVKRIKCNTKRHKKWLPSNKRWFEIFKSRRKQN